MKTKNPFGKTAVVCLMVLTGLAFASSAYADTTYSTTMVYYEGLDFETGDIHEDEMMFPYPDCVDFHFAYNAGLPIHARVFQEYPAQIAFLDEIPFSEVSYDDIETLTFTGGTIDIPFENDDTIIILTADGNYFKMGNAVEDSYSNGVTFDYQQLTQHTPEPATCMILCAGLTAAVLRRRRQS
ncbi:MAG: PEP-CTERM sorting domain-containing protein [Phycisphaerae bacterium]|nr:PEP-CTERM sorting domain-containing protein [Phycisphaerae bacterium]